MFLYTPRETVSLMSYVSILTTCSHASRLLLSAKWSNTIQCSSNWRQQDTTHFSFHRGECMYLSVCWKETEVTLCNCCSYSWLLQSGRIETSHWEMTFLSKQLISHCDGLQTSINHVHLDLWTIHFAWIKKPYQWIDKEVVCSFWKHIQTA